MASSVEIRNVSVDPMLHDITLRIEPGEAIAFIGRSGAGKTTTLRLINGMVVPSQGEVLVDGVSLRDLDIVALRRRTGYIIQGSGLFPHRTVFDNVALRARLLGWDEARIRTAAAELMERLGLPLDRFGSRRPRSLSGGEQQRVGIARALIADPQILLCDEPFAALDPIVRRELQDVFRSMRSGATIVFVTHDVAEALRIAERIVLFDEGRVVADVRAREFAHLDHPLARRFIASATLPGAA
ncbi:MAG: ATP-binding cassette domain-containing protein [Thermoanaerobaculia bacterium]